jgi:hypothetical protein
MTLRPTLDELIQIWINAYARAALIEAEDFFATVQRTAPGTSENRAAMCAAVMSYARPFTPSQVTSSYRTRPLANVSPPASLTSTHQDLLSLRNKVVGHKDATPAPGHAMSPNLVLIRRDSTGFELCTIGMSGMEANICGEGISLCRHFVAHCEAELKPLLERYGSEIVKLSPGTYELVVTDEPSAWLRAFNSGSARRP